MNIYKSSKDNKLRQFTFKVVHRIITTKKELLKYKLASDDKCPFCLNPDSIEHTFLYCQESKEFFSKTLRWFNEYHEENVQLANTPRVTYRIGDRTILDSFSCRLEKLFWIV